MKFLRNGLLLAAILLSLLPLPAVACRPNGAWLQRPFLQKLPGTAFLGKVTAATDSAWEKPGSVRFTVLASKGDPAVGQNVTFPTKDYGTCGKYSFRVGEVWLYAGDGPFGATLKPTAADLGADGGKDFGALLSRISARLDPKTGGTP